MTTRSKAPDRVAMGDSDPARADADSGEPRVGSEVDAGFDADDRLAAMGSLPTVRQVDVIMRPTRPEPPREQEPRKAAIGFVLKPFTPTPRRAMVTMSDLGAGGRPSGGATPARNRKT